MSDFLVDCVNSPLSVLSVGLREGFGKQPFVVGLLDSIRKEVLNIPLWNLSLANAGATAQEVSDFLRRNARLDCIQGMNWPAELTALCPPQQKEGGVRWVPISLENMMFASCFHPLFFGPNSEGNDPGTMVITEMPWSVEGLTEGISPVTIRTVYAALTGNLFVTKSIAPRARLVLVRVDSPIYRLLHKRIWLQKTAASECQIRLDSGEVYLQFEAVDVLEILHSIHITILKSQEISGGKVY
jgi:hypothetical protein